MSNEQKPAIDVNNLSKSYIINHKNKASYSTLKDDVGKLFSHPFRKDATVDSEETFWALNDVSFQVNPGEIFGIIGRNGSGKSTLLKILSRIVEPTKGEAILRGRVASLLEVGTGFNPELTGRENIYFNGSMLGMSKKEISKKFNEIVWFSEVEKFLDTPVKFYSSGMYVRLAFSVAAHLEPDILILDEVLAVGDAAFQKKSLNKILDTMHDGRTVLFVSHSMGSVQQLCSRGMLLNHGEVSYCGPVGELTERYMAIMQDENPNAPILDWSWNSSEAFSNEYFIPKKIYLTNEAGKQINKPVQNSEDHYVNIEATVKKSDDLLNIGYAIHNENKTLMYMSYFNDDGRKSTLPKGNVIMKGKVPANFLNAGTYRISLIGGLHNKFWLFEPGTRGPSIQINISADSLSKSRFWQTPRDGLMAPIISWEIV